VNPFLVYVLVGLVCGAIDSSLGMGYGVSSTSILLSFGIAPAIASASIHTAEGFVDIVSGVSHWKFGNIDKSMILDLLITGVIGAILGAYVLSMLSLEFAKPFVSLILMMLGIVILLKFLLKKVTKERKFSKNVTRLLGFIGAFIDVLGGGGWGPIVTSTLVAKGKDPKKAVGTVEMTEPIISFTAVIVFGILCGFDNFLWSIVLPIMIGGFILTPVSAYVTKKIPKKWFGILVGLWLLILNLRTVLQSLGLL
jgi:uncharacterized membrane protein YfcA